VVGANLAIMLSTVNKSVLIGNRRPVFISKNEDVDHWC